MMFPLWCRVVLVLCQVAQQRDVNEARAQIIVQIPGDARPFLVDGPFLLQLLEPAPQSRDSEPPGNDSTDQQRRHHDAESKEICLPEKRRDAKCKAGATRVPDAITVARGHFELVVTRRQSRVPGTPLSRRRPLIVAAAQAITKFDIFWSPQGQCRKVELNPMMPWRDPHA